jgi:hypothetical protein
VPSATATSVLTGFLSISAGSRERLTVRTVREGERLQTTGLIVQTAEDPQGLFDVALMDGENLVAPVDQPFTMATDEVQLPGTSVYAAGDDITVRLDATDRETSIDVSVLVPVVDPTVETLDGS